MTVELKEGEVFNQTERETIDNIVRDHGYTDWHISMWKSNDIECKYELESNLTNKDSLEDLKDLLWSMLQELSGEAKSNC